MELVNATLSYRAAIKMDRSAQLPIETQAKVLIVSETPSDANLIKRLLGAEFDQVFISVDPDLAVSDFEQYAPDVLVLAFKTLANAERHYLGLYRLSNKIHDQPHRTVVLCNAKEVQQTYKACRKGYFDDYVLFWPVTNDAPRLLMAVHQAISNLSALIQQNPSTSEFATQARRLADLNSILDQQLLVGSQRIASVNRALGQAEKNIGIALDRFPHELKNAQDLTGEINRLKQQDLRIGFLNATKSVEPIKEWTEGFKKHLESQIESANILTTMAGSVRRKILIVDDDEFQHNVLKQILITTNYQLIFATGGAEAINILRHEQPELILMDIMMPEMDGIETLKLLRIIPQFLNIPVIMLTGNSESDIVRDSLNAGATDFVVKPFETNILLEKIAHALNDVEN